MNKPFFFFLMLLLSTASYSQTIRGRVIDSETKLPLEGATVFAQNTTRGVITDKEGQYTITLGKGGFELIFSFSGYENKTANLDVTADRELNIELHKADNSMSEVVIRNSNEVENGWELHGPFFLSAFIGSTPFSDSCLLHNPQALKFLYYKRNDRLKILATEPLLIENRALGYNLRYQLDSFVHFNQSGISSYRGYCFFTEMEGSEEEKQRWKENREKAYYGSRLHFLRSYYDSSLKQDGFTVDILSTRTANKFDRLNNPYDTAYYFFDDATQNAELYFPTRVSITYHKGTPEARYLQHYKLPADVKTQISYVDLLEGIVINPNGYFSDQRSWVNQGYWSWKNLGDLLPYDYDPSR